MCSARRRAGSRWRPAATTRTQRRTLRRSQLAGSRLVSDDVFDWNSFLVSRVSDGIIGKPLRTFCKIASRIVLLLVFYPAHLASRPSGLRAHRCVVHQAIPQFVLSTTAACAFCFWLAGKHAIAAGRNHFKTLVDLIRTPRCMLHGSKRRCAKRACIKCCRRKYWRPSNVYRGSCTRSVEISYSSVNIFGSVQLFIARVQAHLAAVRSSFDRR